MTTTLRVFIFFFVFANHTHIMSSTIHAIAFAMHILKVTKQKIQEKETFCFYCKKYITWRKAFGNSLVYFFCRRRKKVLCRSRRTVKIEKKNKLISSYGNGRDRVRSMGCKNGACRKLSTTRNRCPRSSGTPHT